MKEFLVLGIVALLASMGGGTWYAVLVAPSPPVASSAPAVTHLTNAVVKPVANRERRQPDSAAAAPPADSVPALPPPLPPAPGPDPALAGQTERAKAVGKILAGMKPKEAADILNRMPDDEVERIVRQLNAKQVAALLTALPDDRAATLSRRLLETGSRP